MPLTGLYRGKFVAFNISQSDPVVSAAALQWRWLVAFQVGDLKLKNICLDRSIFVTKTNLKTMIHRSSVLTLVPWIWRCRKYATNASIISITVSVYIRNFRCTFSAVLENLDPIYGDGPPTDHTLVHSCFTIEFDQINSWPLVLYKMIGHHVSSTGKHKSEALSSIPEGKRANTNWS